MRVGDHGCWTTWGPQATIDRPERLRRYTRIRRRLGERRYRTLRYSMGCAHAGLKLHQLIRDLGQINAELDRLT